MVKMVGMAQWFKQHSWLLLIIAVGLSLRLIHLREWFHFEMDEEVVAWKTQQFWADGKPFLIGGGTPFGLHLGPAFYYLSSIPFWFTNGDPIGWGWLAALFGIVTIILCFAVGKTLYNTRVGIFFSLLWSTSFVAVMSDRHWWPLVLNPSLSLLTLLCLYRIECWKFRKLPTGSLRNFHWWLFLGLVLAFAWQTDLSVLPIFLASFVVVVHQWRYQTKNSAMVGLVVLFSFLPLVLFEFRHPGENLGKLLSYRFERDVSISIPSFISPLLKTPRALSQLIIPTAGNNNLNRFYSWCTSESMERENTMSDWQWFLGTGIMIVPAFFLLRNKTQYEVSDVLLCLFFFCGVLGFFLFSIMGGDLFDFYLSGLYPIFLLSAARVGAVLWDKSALSVALFLLLLVVTNVLAVFASFHAQGLGVKQEAVAWASRVVTSPFALESLSQCHRFNGIRYLFSHEGNEPEISFMDQSLSWLYDRPPSTKYPDTFVVFVTPNDLTPSQQERYNELRQYVRINRQFGDFDVLIINNEAHQFSIDF